MQAGSVAERCTLCFSGRVSDPVREAPGGSDPLAAEARLFARTLVGRTPSAALVERYADANRTLFPTPASDADEALVAFARRHPWSTSLLDAACGWLRPGARLREKILVMAAVLETTPEFADEFLPRTAPPAALVVRLAGLGLLAAARAAVGILLLPIATRP
jgi:hypothetical protein